MSRTFIRPVLTVLVALAVIAPRNAHAIIGVGVHYGLDFTLDMEDVEDQQLVYDGLAMSINAPGGTPPPGMPTEISSDLLPIYISRTGFTRTYFNLGGKLLIDAIKWFDIEVSTNIGMWEYLAEISYPTGMTYNGTPPSADSKPEDIFDITYSTLKLTCKDLGIDYAFFDGTPYVKLHFDATVKKTFPKRFKTFKLYAGGGVSVHLATPIISAELIENVLDEQLEGTLGTVADLGTNLFGSEEVMKDVLEEVIAGLTVPKWGLNVVLGTQFKLPVIPLALYLDGKMMIPFGQMDEYVDLNGFGFLVNAGVMLKF